MPAYEDGQVGFQVQSIFSHRRSTHWRALCLLKGLFPLRRLCIVLHGVAWW